MYIIRNKNLRLEFAVAFDLLQQHLLYIQIYSEKKREVIYVIEQCRQWYCVSSAALFCSVNGKLEI
jgi:hypothetical protein